MSLKFAARNFKRIRCCVRAALNHNYLTLTFLPSLGPTNFHKIKVLDGKEIEIDTLNKTFN